MDGAYIVKTINVYWSSMSPYMTQVEEPVPTKQIITGNQDSHESGWNICPAITDYYKNMFTCKSPIDFRFKVNEDNQLFSDSFPYASEVKMPLTESDLSNKQYNLGFIPLFFADCESLPMQQLHPVGCGGDFAEKTSVFQGEMDCAKYARLLDCQFKLHKDCNLVEINQGDALFNLKFLTNSKIKFVRFFPNEEINQLLDVTTGQFLRKINSKPKILQAHYDAFKRVKAHKRLLKLIKQSA